MKKISNFNLISLMVILLFTTTYGEGIYVVIKEAGVDSYLSIIISSIFSLLFIFIFNFLFNYEPDLNIFEKNKKLFKYPFIPNLLVVLFALLVSSVQFFNLTNFIVSQFLSETHPIFIGLIFCLLIIYVGSKDLSVLAKTATIFLFINFFLFFVSAFGLLTEFKFDNLLPFLEHGLNKPILGSIRIFFINVCPLFLLLLIPKNKVINFKNRSTFISYFIYLVLSLIMIILTIGSLGIDLAKLYQYPEYIVLRRINFLNFLTRIENILFIQWIFGLFTLMSFSTFVVKEKLKFRFNYVIIGVLILIISFSCFKSLTIFNEFMYNIYPYIGALFLVYVLIMFVLGKVKTSKN